MGKHKKWTDEEIALLGTMTDFSVAEKTGRLFCNVHYIRTSLKIPSFCKQNTWNAENVALLGTMTDVELSKLLGILPESVHRARLARNIPAFKKNKHSVKKIDEKGIKRKTISIALPADIVDKLTADERSMSKIIEVLLKEHY